MEGGCSCGAVRYRIGVPPLFVHCCHCRNCQRHTGSAFVVNVLIETARVELLQGELSEVEMPLAGGSPNRIFRCARCLVAVWSEHTSPSLRFVRASTLDEPAAVSPDVHIYVRSKLPWVSLPESVPAFEAFYDPKTLWPAETLDRVRAARS
jgi:hypothetical protein